jgi:SAM-dependent methyltransferase
VSAVGRPLTALRVLVWRARRWLRRPPVGHVDLGDLDRTTPVSSDFGFDRGTPIDRFYIDDFLASRRDLVRGRALEVGDASYCRQYGGGAVTRQDVLFVDSTNPEATIIGDVSDPSTLPDAAFDCIVFTQTLHLVYDVETALRQLRRALKPGGALLLTVPGVSMIEEGVWGPLWCWSFTEASARRLFRDVFGEPNFEIRVYGNVLAATAFLQGLAAQEIGADKLAVFDPKFPVTIAVAATRPVTA